MNNTEHRKKANQNINLCYHTLVHMLQYRLRQNGNNNLCEKRYYNHKRHYIFLNTAYS